ncbi:MAG: fibronectin type III domain-containing protein [Candidatus Sumerlaeaceae bacterium]|nr:fibronectin type III domain-containing protein [Candidatus Sumerlaeaceae bacterium]
MSAPRSLMRVCLPLLASMVFLHPPAVHAEGETDPSTGPVVIYRPPHIDWRDTPTKPSKTMQPPAKLSPLNPTANSQPTGALSGVVVYCSAGHGWTSDQDDTAPTDGDRTWYTQRGNFNSVVEDYGNIEQLNFFVEYCRNAGATVVPFRPVGHQLKEVVLDNGSPGVNYTGAWSDTTSTIYYGNPGDPVPYRFASTDTTTQTAAARYTPNIPVSGFYPVYTWVRWGGDRVKQLYRISHSGGESDIRVNHRRVGQGWVWLGNFHFNAGASGYVEISNYAPGESGVVIADAIRFGNGMGDVDRGYGVSGFPREYEASRYWVQRGNGQGITSDIYDFPGFTKDSDDNVGTPPRKSADMNNEAEGTFWERILLSFHTNAGTVNTYGLYINTGSTGTTSQSQLASYVGNEIPNNMEAEDSGVSFEHDWISPRSQGALGGNYGEIRAFGSSPNIGNNDEMAATIGEVASHEDSRDALLLRDPRCRRIIARASYRAILKFLNDGSGGAIPLNFLPEPPTNVAAKSDSSGNVTISWQPPPTGYPRGDAATGYVIYQSSNGYGFSNPIAVAGGSTTSTIISGLAREKNYYFQVAATNAGGESLPSETIGVRIPANAMEQRVLVVNGFDRFDFQMSPIEVITSNVLSTANTAGATFGVILPRQMNSFDYVVQHGEALQTCGRSFDTASNEAVSSGSISLSDYGAVVWIGGEESTFNKTLSSTEQSLLQTYLAAGGKLLITGTEFGADLDLGGQGAVFYNSAMRADFSANDAGSYAAGGVGGGIFSGLNINFSTAAGAPYDADAPDVILPLNGSTAALQYTGPGTTAAVQYSGTGKVVYLAFPFECIGDATTRSEVMCATMNFFGVSAPMVDCNNNGITDSAEIAGNDCNNNGQLDVCDLATPPSLDCDNDGLIDTCEIAAVPSLDCDCNGQLDTCEIASNPSLDCNGNDVLDSCDPPTTFALVYNDTFTSEVISPPGTLNGWSYFGMNTPGFAVSSFDPTSGSLTNFVASESGNPNPRYRISGIVGNVDHWLPQSSIGPANYVRGKFYIFASGQANPAAKNQIPGVRVRLANRFAVSGLQEIFPSVGLDAPNELLYSELAPSTDPAKPSVYRLDFDPVDVPYLTSNANVEGVMRGFEAYAFEPQMVGYINMVQSVIGVYPASQSGNGIAPLKVYQTTGGDAGDLKLMAQAEVTTRSYILSNVEGVFPTSDPTPPGPIFFDSAAGAQLDTSQVSASRVGIISRDFNPDGTTGSLTTRIRIEPLKLYKIRYHLTSTQQANRNSQVRLRARTARFGWSSKFEVGGALAAGGLTNAIAQQALPGVGTQNPDKETADTTGGWYTLFIHSPLDPAVRPEFPQGTPLSASMPLLSSQPGPGVNATSNRDLLVSLDLIDTLSQGDPTGLEKGNVTVDRIEIRQYDEFCD